MISADCADFCESTSVNFLVTKIKQPSQQLGVFPGVSSVKNLPANAGDVGLIPGLGRSAGEGNGNPLQNSCLGNSVDRGAWWATKRSRGVQRVGRD